MGRPGRPPLGERAMTPAEKQRRYRERKFGNKPPVTKATVAALKARIRELEAALAAKGKRDEGQGVTRSRGRAGERPVEFTEVGRLRAQIAALKSDITKLKAALQEEPDTAKLRTKVIEQRGEMASLRQAMRKAVKERDQWVRPNYRAAWRLLTRANYSIIVKALHPDRAQHCTRAELETAARVAVVLKPLFVEG